MVANIKKKKKKKYHVPLDITNYKVVLPEKKKSDLNLTNSSESATNLQERLKTEESHGNAINKIQTIENSS